MTFDPPALLAIAHHIADDTNRAFWARLGATTFDAIVRLSGTLLRHVGDRPPEQITTEVQTDPVLQAILAQLQQIATNNAEFARLAAMALTQQAATGQLAKNLGVVVPEGGVVHIGTLNVGDRQIDKQINVSQSGTKNTQINTFN